MTAPGADLMRQFLPASPFVGHLGLRLVTIEAGRAVLELPFREELVTIGRTVHGGAIAALIDTAAMVAAWSEAPVPANPRGSTVGLTVSYLAPAEQADLRAVATVLRRGRSLVYLDVAVGRRDAPPEPGPGGSELVAKGLVTYRVGGA